MNKYPKFFKADSEVHEIAQAMELAGARTFIRIASRRRDAERKIIEDISCKLCQDEKERRMGIVGCLNWLIELPEKTQEILSKVSDNIYEEG